MRPIRPRLPALRPDLIRFCVIGAIGFVVDATLLLVAIRLAHWAAIPARLLSFSCAVVVTFELNRRWTFASHRSGRYLAILARYVGVQGAGFLCNLTIYAAICLPLPPTALNTLLALAIASASALLVNYLGARKLVFAPHPQQVPTVPDQKAG